MRRLLVQKNIAHMYGIAQVWPMYKFIFANVHIAHIFFSVPRNAQIELEIQAQ